MRWYLAIRIDEEEDSIMFAQRSHIAQALELHELTNFTCCTTSIAVNFFDEAESHKGNHIVHNYQYSFMIVTLLCLHQRLYLTFLPPLEYYLSILRIRRTSL